MSAPTYRPPGTLSRRGFAAITGLSALHLAGVWPARAQAAAYPERPIRIIVPFVAGGGPDMTARVIAEALGQELPQPCFVENIPGGGTIVGTTNAARSKPDGYTLLLASNSLAIAPSLQRNLPYDTLKDFRGVSMVVRQPFALAVHPSVAKTLPELLDKARKNPGRLNYASSGAGTGNHLVTEQFLKMAGIKMEHIPYQGTGNAVTDLLAGRVDMLITTASSLYGYFKSGELRPLGVGEPEPIPQLPEVPPIASAVPGFNETSWNGIVAPAGTPQEVIPRLNDAVARCLAKPEVRTLFERNGAIPKTSTPAEFDRYIESEIGKWREVVEMTGLKIN